MSEEQSTPISRRAFVGEATKAAAAFVAAPMIVPRHVLGRGVRPPSATVNVAIVGAGGMGMENMSQLLRAGENVVAIADVDFPFVERSLAGRLRPRDGRVSPEAQAVQAAYTKAAKYADFRQMLERQRDIDAVLVATPDHTHAVVAAAAMKAGKHVYVQKPLTYSVHEARALARIAKETGVVTQMGNQGHSMEGTRRINELIASGVIGPVREVHIWTDRPQRYWAQGIPGPTQIAAYEEGLRRRQQQASQANAQQAAQNNSGAAAAPPTPPPPPRWGMSTVDNAILEAMAWNPRTVPEGLNWDLFLGPAPERPYHPVYHPFSWRGWVDFGVSAIGDMGAHLMDQAYWALGLTYPTSIIASSTPWGGPARGEPVSYPLAMTARYEFAARGSQPPVTMYWYDGGFLPMLPDVVLPRGDGGGGVFLGSKGYLTYETYGNNPKVYPEAVAAEAERVPKTFPRVTTSHEANWAQAVKGEAKASCPFDYAAPLTELMLLGIVALRAGQSRQIAYDGAAMRVTNAPEVNQWLTREYRAGWSL